MKSVDKIVDSPTNHNIQRGRQFQIPTELYVEGLWEFAGLFQRLALQYRIASQSWERACVRANRPHNMGTNMKRWIRKLHRWGGLLTLVPLFIVIITGLLLQVKKQVPWVQPPTQRGTQDRPILTFEEILSIVSKVPEAEVSAWQDVDRLDVRPGKGIVKVQSNNRWEVQVDSASGEILSSTRRRSDWIESLHDGSFFHESAKLWVFLPNGLVLLGLWMTGAYLWWLPIGVRRKKRGQTRQNGSRQTPSP